jgi:serine/threonine protein kinase
MNTMGVPASFITALFKKDAPIVLRFEQFTLESLLGSGGLGVVIKAKKTTGLRVALKFLYSQEDTTGTILERFKNEIRATKTVGDISDSCVRVYECGEYPVPRFGRVPFFSMEYVPGLSLEDFILLRETPFTPLEIYVIARQIALALDDIHSKGIVHRDIKPSNILVHETRRIIKVTDFGISRDVTADTGMTMTAGDGGQVILGTPNYLSRYYFDTVPIDKSDVSETTPGRFVRKSTGEHVTVDDAGRFVCAYKGRKLDISVLASTILFELTTRVSPFAGSPITAILTDIMKGTRLDLLAFYKGHPDLFHEQIRRKPAFLSRLARIVRNGCVAQRSKTYASAEQLVADLDRAAKCFCGRVPGPSEKDEIMATLLGKTLVDEYEHVMRRIERAVRDGTESQDRSNISRLTLLYKLKKTDRLMACVELLHAKTVECGRRRDPQKQELLFLLELWERLERFGIEDKYRENCVLLKNAFKRSQEGSAAP